MFVDYAPRFTVLTPKPPEGLYQALGEERAYQSPSFRDNIEANNMLYLKRSMGWPQQAIAWQAYCEDLVDLYVRNVN